MPGQLVTMQKILLAFSFMISCISLTAQSANPLRVGIAGVVHDHVHGIFGREHKGDLEIVGIAEPNRAVAVQYCKRYGLDSNLIYPSLAEMVTKTKPEAVLAFNAIFDHLAVVEYCAPLGIHVMVEKPLAVSETHSRRMLALAAKHKIQLLTNYETTSYPSLQVAYEKGVERKELGELRRLVFHTGHPGPKEIGCSPQFLAWLTDPTLNGAGALNDFGCYGANTSTWLLQGKTPQKVTAITMQVKPQVYPKVDDDATIILQYADNTEVIIQASWNWPFGRKDMEMYGRTGYLFCQDATHLQYRETEKSATVPITGNSLPAPYNDPYGLFVKVIRGEVTLPAYHPASMENNKIVVKILEAARLSAKQGRTISWKEVEN